jgi:hypothetical protein
MPGSRVYVEGLDETIRAFGRMDRRLSGDIRKQMRGIGQFVAKAANENAKGQGLVGKTKRLSRGNRPAVKGSTLLVRNRVENRGFNYPAVSEYKRGRAFLEPALDEQEPRVIREFERMLDELGSDWAA